MLLLVGAMHFVVVRAAITKKVSPNMCCAHAGRCGKPRIEKKETATIPMKRLQRTPINQIYTPLHCGRWAH